MRQPKQLGNRDRCADNELKKNYFNFHLTTQAMLAKSRLLSASLLSMAKSRALIECKHLNLRQLASTNVAGPAFTSPPPAPRPDVTLVGPLGPLQNQDYKTSTVELSPACMVKQ